ncbi:hypothetical protein [Pseudonocardia adelaidensis]|uniref:Ferredoxin n=1 Tax=Pseudonocardia adelaidensis TaxID=648754 RepID=A0ABP9NXR5_9PSEU
MSIDRIHCHVATCDDCRLTFDETGSGYPIYVDNADDRCAPIPVTSHLAIRLGAPSLVS